MPLILLLVGSRLELSAFLCMVSCLLLRIAIQNPSFAHDEECDACAGCGDEIK